MKSYNRFRLKSKINIFWLLIILVYSCDDSNPNRLLLPNITGKAGEITVVIDDDWWNSSVGDSIKELFSKPYPYLPQSEPTFDIYHINHKAFTNIFKRNRNIIQVFIKSYISDAKITIKQNVWANKQLLIIIEAGDEKSVHKLLQIHGKELFNTIYDIEQNRYKDNYERYTEKRITADINQKYHINITVPLGFMKRKDTLNFSWYSTETSETSQGIFIWDYPYYDTIQLRIENLIKVRDSILRKNVPGPLPNTWMTTETLIQPAKKVFVHEKTYTIEIRGLWKVRNDFMGGPFISYTKIDTLQSRIITVDAYVYAPKFDKRNYIMQCEAILNSVQIDYKKR